VDGEYDFKALTAMAVTLKHDYPDANDASVLLERNVQYDYLIQAMDAIRSAEVPEADPTLTAATGTTSDTTTGATKRLELFSQIAVGEAP
jgi:hypothetical protein